MATKASRGIIVLGIFIFVALGSVLLPTPSQADLPGCEGIKTAMEQAETRCISTLDLAERIFYFNQEAKFEKQVDILGCDDLESYSCFCGGLLNEDRTYVSITPASSSLKVADTVQLNAKIVTSSCLMADGKRAGCFDTCSGGWFEETLVGNITWSSLTPDIAVVDGNGLVTALKPGTANIVAVSTDLPKQIAGRAVITVQAALRLDVVFMYNLLPRGWVWDDPSTGLQQMGNTFLGLLNQNFDDYRIAIVTHAHYPTFVELDPTYGTCDMDPTQFGFKSWGPYEAYTPVLPFQWSGSSDTPAKVVAAYQSLSPTCQLPPLYLGGQVSTSLYTALMSAIDGSTLGGWRAEEAGVTTERVIIFDGDDWGCGMEYYVVCDVEAVSGLTSADVISAARAKNIHLFPVLLPIMDFPNTQFYASNMATQTGGTVGVVPMSGGTYADYSDLALAVSELLAGIAQQRP